MRKRPKSRLQTQCGGTREMLRRIPTLLYNGYGEYVARLYS